MANMFTNIPEALSSSTDFLHCKVNLPHHDPLIYAQYATSYYEVSSMQSIKLTGESKKRFRYFYLVPDLKSLAEERESASYDCEVEELLGEAKESLSKVKTTIITSTTISNVHHLCDYLAKTSAQSLRLNLYAACPSPTSTPRPCSTTLVPLPSSSPPPQCGHTSRRAITLTSPLSSGP
jgi:hypothetical protein